LGLDPGASAGAALLDGPLVLAWWAWTYRRASSDWRLRSSMGEIIVPSMHQVGRHIALAVGPPCLVAVEGLYVDGGRGKKAAAKRISTLACAEHAGAVMAALGELGPISRPTWQKWNLDVLNIESRIGERRAADLAVQECKRRYVLDPWPKLTRGEELAVAEACHMAAWLSL